MAQPDKHRPWLTEAEALASQPLITLTDYLAQIDSVDEPASRTTLLSLQTAQPLELSIEPWGPHIFLDPHIHYVVIAYNHTPTPAQPDVLIQWGEGYVALYANTSGTMLEIFRDGPNSCGELPPTPYDGRRTVFQEQSST